MKRIAISLLLLTTIAHASTPLWTFTPLTATTISVSPADTATIQYQITNQSMKSHTLSMVDIPGITQDTSSSLCKNPFTLGYQQSCTLSLAVDGSVLPADVVGGPVLCQRGSALQCYQPSAEDSLNISLITTPATSLLINLTDLALQTNGNARIITITNGGAYIAENLFIDYPTWPSGTVANSTCGSSLISSASCTITITPGPNATSDCDAGQGSQPTAGIISVGASNASTVTTSAEVLTYGCIYQQGYIFAIDDTTPTTGSIGGSSAALIDNAVGMSWGDAVTTGAQSLSNGLMNTETIVATPGIGTNAAELCTNYSIDTSGNSPCLTGTCYSNWYLPAICQMGASGEGAGCSTGIQNMATNLSALVSGICTGSACLAGNEYWSSTEYSSSPANEAWVENFLVSPIQVTSNKSMSLHVRCARDLAY